MRDTDREARLEEIREHMNDLQGYVAEKDWRRYARFLLTEVDRLRARQREEEGDEWNELLSRAVELRQSDSASEEEVREWAEKLTRDILAAEEAGQFAGEDGRLVPEACPHCSGLMGHYGDCPHAPQQEREREQ